MTELTPDPPVTPVATTSPTGDLTYRRPADTRKVATCQKVGGLFWFLPDRRRCLCDILSAAFFWSCPLSIALSSSSSGIGSTLSHSFFERGLRHLGSIFMGGFLLWGGLFLLLSLPLEPESGTFL